MDAASQPWPRSESMSYHGSIGNFATFADNLPGRGKLCPTSRGRPGILQELIFRNITRNCHDLVPQRWLSERAILSGHVGLSFTCTNTGTDRESFDDGPVHEIICSNESDGISRSYHAMMMPSRGTYTAPLDNVRKVRQVPQHSLCSSCSQYGTPYSINHGAARVTWLRRLAIDCSS